MTLVGIVDSADLCRQFINQCLIRFDDVVCRPFRTITQVERYLQSGSLNCLIVDAQMESNKGFSLVRNIRMGRFKCRHDMPIIVCTSDLEKAQALELVQFRVQAISVKPVSATMLETKFEECKDGIFLDENTQFFEALDEKMPVQQPESERAKASIVLDIDLEGSTSSLSTISKALDEAKGYPRFISWPNNATSGFHQLDSRLKNITSIFNALHWAVKNKRSVLNDSHTQQVLMFVDDLIHVCKGLKARHPEKTVWDYLTSKLSRVKMIDFDELTMGKVPEARIERLFKIIRKRWLEVLKTVVSAPVSEDKVAS